MSGNGVDLGQIVAMLHTLIQQQADMREEFRAQFAEHSSILNEHTRILNEHSRRFSDLDRQMAELRAEVASYHASVVGHGILISEIDARLRRVEEHLNLPSAA